MTTPIFIRILLAIFISTLLPLRGGAANPAFLPQTQPADGITHTQAVLHGTIGLDGKAAYVAFQIRRADKRYVGHTPWQKISRGQTNVTFSATASRLSLNTDYDFRAIALIKGVKRTGIQFRFRSAALPPPSVPPTVTFASASGITASNAVLGVSVNPNGAATLVTFEWGPSISYGNTTPGQSIGFGTNAVSVQAPVSGLALGTVYYWRIVATNSAGVTYNNGLPFTPLAPAVAETLPPGEVHGDRAVLVGRYNTFGQFGPVSVVWGLTTNYGHYEYLGQNNSVFWEQTALEIGGLTPNTTYHYRFSAGNSLGGSAGEDVAFTTAGSAPAAITTNPVVGSATNAMLNAIANSGDLQAALWFEWGTTSNYSARTAIQTLSSSTNAVAVQMNLFPIRAATTYHYRAVASNQLGVSYGSDVSFVTLPGTPVAVTEFASDITSESAILHASVNPSGLPTLVLFEWGLNASYGNSVTAGQLSGGAETIAVSSTITSLLFQVAYHYRVVASNSLGVTVGNDRAFVTVCRSSSNAIVITNCMEADLRAALASASSIRFACDGTITLTRPIDVDCFLTLDASGHSVTISGGNSNRLFNVGPGGSLKLFSLTVANGATWGTNSTDFHDGGPAEGGALWVSRATVVAVDCHFELNSVTGGAGGTNSLGGAPSGGSASGAAIRADSSILLLTNCSFLGNRAAGGNGGWFVQGSIQFQGPAGSANGGALSANDSSIQIVNCSFRTNNAGAGAAIEVTGGTLQIQQSSFVQNDGSSDGGGILNNGASVVVFACEFTGNSVVSPPSGIPISGWPLGVPTCGGGICQSSGSLEVSDCQFTSNVSFGAPSGSGSSFSRPVQAYNGQGGAVGIKGGAARIQRSTFVSNGAVGGGASSFVGSPFNWADSGEGIGGAVFSQGMVSITNCTFASNVAASGSIPFDNFSYPRPDPNAGKGGALANLGGTLQIFSSTIASNSAYNGANHHPTNAAYGGGIFNGSSSTLLIANSILAWNNVNATNAGNVFGLIVDGDRNLSSDATANFTAIGSLNNTDPLLGPFGDYGGLTLTFPLLPGSPAIDAADPASSPSTDQRGLARPQGPAPDIGAFERQ